MCQIQDARFLQQTRIWRATQNDMMPQSSVAADTKTTQSGVESGSYESDRLKIADAGFTAGNNSVSVLPESTTTPQELHTAITEATRDLATAREVNRQLEQLRTSLEGEIEGLRKELQERDAVIQKLLQRLNESEGGKSSITATGPGEGQSNSKAVQRVMPPADGYAVGLRHE